MRNSIMSCRNSSSFFTREVPRTWRMEAHTKRDERSKKPLKENCSHHSSLPPPKKHIKRSEKGKSCCRNKNRCLVLFFINKGRLLKYKRALGDERYGKPIEEIRGKFEEICKLEQTVKAENKGGNLFG